MPLSDLFSVPVPTPRPTQTWDLGYLPAVLHLDPNTAPSVPQGAARPFGRGEYMDNPNGSWSSEMTYDLSDPRLNNGRPTIIPGLWLKNGSPYHANEDEAAAFAVASGLHWPSYATQQQATDVATARENAWQAVPRTQAARGAPLYVNPMVGQ